MSFDLEGARRAGYSEPEIAGFLAQQYGLDVDAARKAGWGDKDIIAELSSGKHKPKAAAAPVAPASPPVEPAGLSPEWGGFDQPAPSAPAREPGSSVLDREPTSAFESSRLASQQQALRQRLERERGSGPQPTGTIGAPPPGTGLNGLSERAGRAVMGLTANPRLAAAATEATDAALLVPEAVTAGAKLAVDITNLGTLGLAQPVSDWLTQTTRAVQAAKSDRFQAQQGEFQQLLANPNAGVLDVAAFMASNPRFAFEVGAPSVPSMLLGAAGARLGMTLLGQSGATAGAAVTNAAMNAGATFSDTSGDLSQKLAAAGAAGAGTALLGRMGGAETALATGRAAGARGVAGTALREGAQEGGESLAQSLGQGTAEGNFDPAQAAKQATVEAVAGGMLGGGVAAIAPARADAPESPYSRAAAAGFRVEPPLTTDTPQVQRSKTEAILDNVAAMYGIPPKVVKMLRAGAEGKPLADLGPAYARGIAWLQERGLVPQISPEVIEALGHGSAAPPLEEEGGKPAKPAAAPAPSAGQDDAVSRIESTLRSAGAITAPVAPAPAPTSPIDEAAHQAATSPLNDKPEPTDAQKEAGNYAKGHVRISGLDVSIENPKGSMRRGGGALVGEIAGDIGDRLGGVSHLRGIIESLARVYMEQGADAGRAALEDRASSARGDSGFSDEVATPGFIDELDAQLRKETQGKKPGWQVEMPAHYGYIRGTKGADGDHVDLFIGKGGDNGRFWVINQMTPDGKKFDEHKVVTGVDSADEAVALYKASFADGFGDRVFDSIGEEHNAEQLRALLPSLERPKPARATPPPAAAATPVAPPAAPPPAPPAPQAPPVRLQNRNRSDAAYVQQMRSIAKAPDPGRLGFSRDFASGAPVALGAGATKGAVYGRTDYVTTSRGRRIKVRYAVVEADSLLTSNTADGSRVEGYEAGLPGRARVVAGNGRAAGLVAGYEQGTADGYRAGLAEDAALHGIDEAALAKFNRPVLVREMGEADVTADIGDESNVSGIAERSAPEVARDDARRIDLAALEFDEDGSFTDRALRDFIDSQPVSEQTALRDARGQPTRQAIDRLTNAVFAAAYENDALLALQAQATEPEARTVMTGLVAAAPQMVRLRGMGDLDIRPLVVEAAIAAVNARRRGIKLADMASQADLDASPEILPVLEMFARNVRSARRIGDNLRAAANLAFEEASKPAEDIFGDVPKRSRSQVLKETVDDTAGAQDLEEPAGAKPAAGDAVGATSEPNPAGSGAGTEAKRAAQGDQEDARPLKPATRAEIVELRKRLRVLESLRACLAS